MALSAPSPRCPALVSSLASSPRSPPSPSAGRVSALASLGYPVRRPRRCLPLESRRRRHRGEPERPGCLPSSRPMPRARRRLPDDTCQAVEVHRVAPPCATVVASTFGGAPEKVHMIPSEALGRTRASSKKADEVKSDATSQRRGARSHRAPARGPDRGWGRDGSGPRWLRRGWAARDGFRARLAAMHRKNWAIRKPDRFRRRAPSPAPRRATRRPRWQRVAAVGRSRCWR